MISPIERRAPRVFLAGLLMLLALGAWQWRNGAPLSTDILELVPGSSRDALQKSAEQRMQEPLNRELLVLVGYPERDRAIAAAARLADAWRAGALFEKVQTGVQADLPALREQLLRGRLALLGATTRERLIDNPKAFIEQRVQQLFDPFAGFGLIANQQDWLGLAAAIAQQRPASANVQLDLGSGAFFAEADGLQWALLRARTRADAFDMNAPLEAARLVAEARAQVTADGGRLVAASGLLYAAAAQQQATREITWVGGGATVGALLLLLLAFRRVRVLLAFLPVVAALLAGCVACVALFGHINVLTLMLGSSLIGVASDYPLHYLSKSWGAPTWRSWDAVRATLPGLSLSLATNLIGYLALACTPFPALTQVAVFSVAGLLAAYLCSICLLPALLNGLQLRPRRSLLRLAQLAAHLLQVEVNGGKGLAERVDRPGDTGAERRRRGEADLHLAQFAELRTARDIGRLVDLRQHQTRLLEEQPARLAELDPTIGTLEQASPQLLLQCLDLLAEGRLGDAQQLCGAAEVQFLGHRDEVAQVTQFHSALQLSRFRYQTGRMIYWM